MTNPWFIMVVGVLTVFAALFLIIAFLLAFPWFFRVIKRKEHEPPAPLPQLVEVHPAEPKEDEEELVAVLTAAVAAARGAAPGTFAITSISPAQSAAASAGSAGGFNTPVWGRIERLSRK